MYPTTTKSSLYKKRSVDKNCIHLAATERSCLNGVQLRLFQTDRLTIANETTLPYY